MTLRYACYADEKSLPELALLIEKGLSEPYSVYTYRYFLQNWPDLCLMAIHENKIIGVIVGKVDEHPSPLGESSLRGYIAMLAVDESWRCKGIASRLIRWVCAAMRARGAVEVVLETELTNTAALSLYEQLGFVRDKRLARYYLNGVDAFRLKLWLE